VEKGERVVGTMQMSGTEMMRIADLNAMEVQVEVSENDIVRVNIGDEADIEVDAYQNKKFTGRVTEVSNSASNLGTGIGGSISTDQVTKFIVKVRIEKESYADLVAGNSAAPFKPGMSATVEIKTSKVENVLSIPIQAVVAYDPDAELKKKKEKEKAAEESIAKTEKKVAIKENPFIEAVFILMGDTVHRVDVKTGIQDQNFIEIISGLKEGDEVVTGPYVAISRELKSGNKAHRKKEESDEKKKK
jgi:HlyD family secretion protein